MKNQSYLESNRTSDLYALYQAAHYSYSWLWGEPEGLSDRPEAFRRFLEETDGLRYIESTQVIRIDEIDEEVAIKLTSFLRYPPIVLRPEVLG